MKRYYLIKNKPLNIPLYLYFSFEEFNKDYCGGKQEINNNAGYQQGNGIWIDLDYKDYEGIVVHEISHYLDWTFDEIFECRKLFDGSEIRARLHEYLYNEVMKIIKKHFAQLK